MRVQPMALRHVFSPLLCIRPLAIGRLHAGALGGAVLRESRNVKATACGKGQEKRMGKQAFHEVRGQINAR